MTETDYDKNPPTLTHLQTELYRWEVYNFGVQDIMPKILGICEEAGELCHAVLKMKQGIRGSTQEHREAMRDAIGDVAIYALNTASTRRIEIAGYPEGPRPTTPMRDALRVVKKAAALADLADCEADMSGCMDSQHLAMLITSLFASINTMASHLEEDLGVIVKDTYRHVTRRNWKDHPKTGGEGQ